MIPLYHFFIVVSAGYDEGRSWIAASQKALLAMTDTSVFSGGGGIRTHVEALDPPSDFESAPLWPLRYPSGFDQNYTEKI